MQLYSSRGGVPDVPLLVPELPLLPLLPLLPSASSKYRTSGTEEHPSASCRITIIIDANAARMA